MFLKLRVFFTILSAICLGLTLPLGAMLHYIWAVVMGLGALLFFLLMLIFKQEQEKKESANDSKSPTFFEPAEKTEIDKKDEDETGQN